DRPTVGIDASLPEIFVLPKIDEEWEKYSQPESTDYDKKINELDAKVITAQTEIERLDEQIKEINRQMTDLNDNKGF
ncbi:viral A-type inclusion protein, partial [Enterococcus faecalis]